MSCPRIDREAFHAEGLDERLAAEGRKFLDSPRGVRIDVESGTVRLSKYFDWYGDDFGDNHIAYIKRYIGPEKLERLQRIDDPDIEYMDYDWRLNDQNAEWAPEAPSARAD